MKYFILLLCLLTQSAAFAARPINLSGRVLRVDDTPIEDQFTSFKIKIENAANCVLLEEEHQNRDMTDSNGYFKLTVGQGTAVYNANGVDIFRATTYSCQNGSTWIAAQGEVRKITMSVKVNTDPWVEFSSDIMNSQAYANDSEYLQGKKPSDFVQVNASTTQAGIDALSDRKSALLDLANGISTLYATPNSVTTNLATKQNLLSYTPMNPASNLSDVTSKAQARYNLDLKGLALKDVITETDLSGTINWNKIGSKPLTFAPSLHSHDIADVSSLSTILASKVEKSSFVCTSTQVTYYNSVSDAFLCANITLGGDVQGDALTNEVTRIRKVEVDITSGLQDKMVLQYDAASNKWKPVSLSGSGNIPRAFAGEVFAWPKATCPAGSVAPTGGTASSATYPDLYAVLGTTYGAISTVTENGQPVAYFRLPDYRGAFLRALDEGRGLDSSGRAIGDYQGDTFGAHQHVSNFAPDGNFSPGNKFGSSGEGASFKNTTGGVAGSTLGLTSSVGASETRPKNVSVKFCMRSQNIY